MAKILIRNIDDAVVEALRRRAAACGISMEEQARRALSSAVGWIVRNSSVVSTRFDGA